MKIKYKKIVSLVLAVSAIGFILVFLVIIVLRNSKAEPTSIPLSTFRFAHNASTITVGSDNCFSQNLDHTYAVPQSLNFGLYTGAAPDPLNIVLSQIASNYRGSTGSLGDLWLAIFDATAQPTATTSYQLVLKGSGSPCYPLGAHGPGLVALYNEGGGKFLHLWGEENGNTDAYALRLCTWKPSGTPIPCTTLAIKQLNQTTDPACFLARNVSPYSGWPTLHESPKWAESKMVLNINGDQLTVDGTLTPYTNPNDPSSSLRATSCGTVHYSGSLAALGLNSTGMVGAAGAAINSFVSSSMVNLSVELMSTQP